MAKRASRSSRETADQMGLAALAVVILAAAVVLLTRFEWANRGVQVQGAKTEIESMGDELR